MINLSNATHVASVNTDGDLSCPELDMSSAELFEPLRTKDTSCMPVDQIAERQVSGLIEQEPKAVAKEENKHCEPVAVMPFLHGMFEGLVDEVDEAYDDPVTRVKNHYTYLANALDEQQFTRKIGAEGGVIVENNEDFFVIEDSNGNRHVIDRKV